MSNSVSDAIADLVIKGAVTEALHRYCVAVDRIDEAAWRQVWHRDAVAHYEEIFDGPTAGATSPPAHGLRTPTSWREVDILTPGRTETEPGASMNVATATTSYRSFRSQRPTSDRSFRSPSRSTARPFSRTGRPRPRCRN
jgi:SnoaL-like domain